MTQERKIGPIGPDKSWYHEQSSKRLEKLFDLLDPASGPLRILDTSRELSKDELVELLDEEIKRG